MTTSIGNVILGILNETNSVLSVIKYFRENQLFEDNLASCERYREKYEYQIPHESWVRATGINMTMDDIAEYVDGNIWLDRYFDSDYIDYDCPYRYVYLSLHEPELIAYDETGSLEIETIG